MSQRSKRRRRFALTRQGKGYVFVTFGVGIAAINTGNNLLYLILGLLLSLLLVSGTLSDLALYELRAKRRLPMRLYAGRAHPVEVTLENQKRFLPSFSLEIREEGLFQVFQGHPPEAQGHPPEAQRHPPVSRAPGALAPFQSRGAYVVRVPARTQVTVTTSLTPQRRGLQQLGMLLVVTRYPFGLIEKVSRRAHPEELLVYPAVRDVPVPPILAQQAGVVDTSPRPGHGPDLLGLRPHHQDDEARDIHWRRSASMGRLVSRERAADADRSLTLLIDERPPADPALRDAWERGFELAISECAALAVASLARGVSVAVSGACSMSARVDGGAVADPILRYLALLQPATATTTEHTRAGAVAPELPAAPVASSLARAARAPVGVLLRVPVQLTPPPGAADQVERPSPNVEPVT